MAYPTDIVATGDLITAAQINRWCVLLADTLVTGSAVANVDLTSIPAHWTNLLMLIYARATGAVTETSLNVRFNNDSAGNYDEQALAVSNTVVSAGEALGGSLIGVGACPGASATANQFSAITVSIPYYAGAADHKSVLGASSRKRGTSSGDLQIRHSACFWRSTAAINRITVIAGSGNLEVGTRVSLYGMGRI